MPCGPDLPCSDCICLVAAQTPSEHSSTFPNCPAHHQKMHPPSRIRHPNSSSPPPPPSPSHSPPPATPTRAAAIPRTHESCRRPHQPTYSRGLVATFFTPPHSAARSRPSLRNLCLNFPGWRGRCETLEPFHSTYNHSSHEIAPLPSLTKLHHARPNLPSRRTHTSRGPLATSRNTTHRFRPQIRLM